MAYPDLGENVGVQDGLTTSDMTALQALIQEQGLTKEQVTAQFGLSPETLSYLTGQGITFAAGPGINTNPGGSGGLMNATSSAVNSAEPVIATTTGSQINQMDSQVNQMDAAAPTPAPQPWTEAGVKQAATEWWANAEANNTPHEERRAWLVQQGQQLGISADQFSQMVGISPEDFNKYMSGETPPPTPAPTPAPGPAPAPTPTPAPTPAPGSTGYGGSTLPPAAAPATGLMGATITPFAAGTAGIGSINAASATAAAPVVAGQGTAGSYTATQAATAAPVTAGQATATQATSQGYTATDAQAALQGAANTYDGAQGTAATWTPDDKSTVQGQVKNIIADNSALQVQAATRAKQEKNKLGLMNSSMAVQAGQAALYDAAIPIASQDASTFATAGQYNAGNAQQMNLANMASKNQGLEFSASAKNKVMSENSQLQTNVNLANAGETNKASAFTAAEANATSKFNAQTATQVSQFNVDKALQAGIINQEQANKMAAINAQFANDASQFNVSQANDMLKANLDRALQAGIINQDQANKISMFNAGEQNKIAATMATINADLAKFNVSEANRVALDIAKFNASESNDLLALGMTTDTQLALGQMEADYKTLMQTQVSAGNLYTQTMSSIAGILSNDAMDEPAKQAAIANLVGILNSSLGVIGSITNLDLPELDFGGPAATPAPTPAPAPAGQSPAAAPGSGAVDVDGNPVQIDYTGSGG